MVQELLAHGEDLLLGGVGKDNSNIIFGREGLHKRKGGEIATMFSVHWGYEEAFAVPMPAGR